MQQCDILEDMLIDFIAERHSLAWGLIYKRLHKEGVRHILSKLWDLYKKKHLKGKCVLLNRNSEAASLIADGWKAINGFDMTPLCETNQNIAH